MSTPTRQTASSSPSFVCHHCQRATAAALRNRARRADVILPDIVLLAAGPAASPTSPFVARINELTHRVQRLREEQLHLNRAADERVARQRRAAQREAARHLTEERWVAETRLPSKWDKQQRNDDVVLDEIRNDAHRFLRRFMRMRGAVPSLHFNAPLVSQKNVTPPCR
mgnify:FL=1